MSTNGVILFNRGPNMVVRALVTMYSLRKYYDGPVTFYIEEPTPKELENCLKYFDCNIVHNEVRHDMKTLVRKNSLFENPPYEKTLWLDIDTVIVGKIDKMFDYLDENDVDLCIPSFCGWRNTGHHMAKRIKRFKGLVDDRYLNEALKDHPSINTGVLSFRKSEKWAKFVRDWTDLAQVGSQNHIFIPDETAANVYIPMIYEWGLKCFIAPTDYNVSVLHDHDMSKDKRIIHCHGDKHVLDVPMCDLWKNEFKTMYNQNIANIKDLIPYADKRLKVYLQKQNGLREDVTIVTACDPHYVKILQQTYGNWRKYKNIDKFPVIVFVNGLDIQNDKELDFLRLPNVTMIPWSKEVDLDGVTDHREEMLSAFVFGAAKYVKTEYWMKLDADSYATDYRPLFTDEMKKYKGFIGHKWGYSRPQHIELLDKWASEHPDRKLKAYSKVDKGRIEGNRFYHNVRRTISFIQLHKTKFVQYCVNKLLKERRLPAPTQDTFLFYVIQAINPTEMATANFKKHHGFVQAKGKSGWEHVKKCVDEVERRNVEKVDNDIQDDIVVDEYSVDGEE